jgi:hypothetical protein
MAPNPIHFAILKRNCKYSDGYHCYAIPQGAIVGIVIGSAAVLLGLLLLVFICVRMRRRRNKRNNKEQVGSMLYSGSAKPVPIAFNPDAY